MTNYSRRFSLFHFYARNILRSRDNLRNSAVIMRPNVLFVIRKKSVNKKKMKEKKWWELKLMVNASHLQRANVVMDDADSQTVELWRIVSHAWSYNEQTNWSRLFVRVILFVLLKRPSQLSYRCKRYKLGLKNERIFMAPSVSHCESKLQFNKWLLFLFIVC